MKRITACRITEVTLWDGVTAFFFPQVVRCIDVLYITELSLLGKGA